MHAAVVPLPTEDGVRAALRDVIDPELGFNIVDLGLIYEVAVDRRIVDVRMTMTTPGCPAQGFIANGVEQRLAREDGITTTLDVRSLVPAERHRKIFETYDGLPVGDKFLLVDDHDPKPLYYQFDAEHKGEFSWRYLEQGPQVWRVEIGPTKLARAEAR
jgi:uncharacterized protein (DUF2249 family)